MYRGLASWKVRRMGGFSCVVLLFFVVFPNRMQEHKRQVVQVLVNRIFLVPKDLRFSFSLYDRFLFSNCTADVAETLSKSQLHCVTSVFFFKGSTVNKFIYLIYKFLFRIKNSSFTSNIFFAVSSKAQCLKNIVFLNHLKKNLTPTLYVIKTIFNHNYPRTHCSKKILHKRAIRNPVLPSAMRRVVFQLTAEINPNLLMTPLPLSFFTFQQFVLFFILFCFSL